MIPLSVTDLMKRFGGLIAVSDVSFEVNQGEILGLIGPNGAGKTTIFNLLTGFIAPDEGSVYLKGAAVNGWPPERRCSEGMARTFQIVKPFGNITVLDNVVMGAMLRERSIRAARARALDVLARVSLREKAGLLARTLPIGDRKRLELARALATDPEVLLLDEVMGGLIPAEVNVTMQLLVRLRDAGMAIVVIEHNMHAIMSLSDRITVLHHGRQIAQGRPAEIARNEAVLAAYLGAEYQFAVG